MLPGAHVADAHVILAAILAGERASSSACLIPVRQEVERYIPVLAARCTAGLELYAAALRMLPITWYEEEAYLHRHSEAERRMATRDPDDWPVVALALALGVPVWTQDKDLGIPGIRCYIAGELLDTL